jgi:hypothetical protein
MMGVTIEFLYENMERVKQLDDEVLDEAKVKEIINLKPLDTITLGSGRDKVVLQVQKINHNFESAEISKSGEDNLHHEYIVKVVKDI